MRIIEKKKISEGMFWAKDADVNKFFSAIAKAQGVLDSRYLIGLEPDDYMIEYAKIFGAYMKVTYDTLIGFGNKVNIKDTQLQNAFISSYKKY